jgi:IS5 family transposase
VALRSRLVRLAKVRYRRLKKNTHRLLVTCVLANMFMARRRLLHCAAA